MNYVYLLYTDNYDCEDVLLFFNHSELDNQFELDRANFVSSVQMD